MSATMMDINLAGLFNINRIYVPIAELVEVDTIFGELKDGCISRFTAMMGSDEASRDQLLVMKRDEISYTALPPGGRWLDIDYLKTELTTIRRFLGRDDEALVEEMLKVGFESDGSKIVFDRIKDDWHEWKLRMTVSPTLEHLESMDRAIE